jgi:hypothetical protein
MARLWTCGFELQSTTANVEFTSLTGTASISTTVHRAGAAALRSNPVAGTGFIEQQVDTAATVKRTFHRVYLRIDTLPSATTTVLAIGQSGFFPIHLRLTTTGTLQLRDNNAGTDVGAPSAALALNTWYRIEVDAQDSGSSGVTRAVVAYLDGVAFSGTTAIAGTSGYSRCRVGAQTACTTDLHFDDIAVNDTTGTGQTGLPGEGSVVHLYPAGAGDNNVFATTVGGTAGTPFNWTRVDETPPDDATSYNETTATGTTAVDDFTLAASGSAGIGAFDTISVVAVGARIGSNAATAASLVYRLKSQPSGTVAESASVSVALNGWATHRAGSPFVHQLVSYTDPQAGGAWTPALLDTAQIGYRANVSQTTVRRVSTLWLLVEFVPTSTVPFDELTDTFDAASVDLGKWPDNYHEGGGPLPDQAGGRARVPCTAGNFSAFASGTIYTLAESYVHARVYPPAVGGASGSVFCQLLILSSTVGTQIVFEVDVNTNLLLMAVHVGFVDENPGSMPYDPVAHAWLRIREASGQLNWDTSPDGRTWTTQHAEMAPAWVSDGDLQAQLLAYRDDGTDDYAYFDDFNITPQLTDGYTVAIDWAADGSFDGPYDDVTADVLARGAVVFQYGRDADRQIAPPVVGSMTMTLCNADRIYSPENPDSPLVNDLRPAAPVTVETVVDNVLYPLFRARIDEFEVHPDRGDRSADITALSLLSLLQNVKISTELYQAQRTGSLFGIVLDAVGWTGPRDLDLGATFVPWWWLEETDAFTAVTDLLASEGAPSIAYVGPDGTFIFRDRHHRLLRAASLTPQAIFSADAAGECSPVYGYGTGGYGEGGYGGA